MQCSFWIKRCSDRVFLIQHQDWNISPVASSLRVSPKAHWEADEGNQNLKMLNRTDFYPQLLSSTTSNRLGEVKLLLCAFQEFIGELSFLLLVLPNNMTVSALPWWICTKCIYYHYPFLTFVWIYLISFEIKCEPDVELVNLALFNNLI